LEDISISKASIIYDSKWNELYKIFKENRTYVEYKDINLNMINAIIAWEDKRFWNNPWFDLNWLARSLIYRIFWKNEKLEWTSTISQQLMKIMYLWGERSIERKIKELYLSYKLNKFYSKEKILELYLNKVFFWNNSYWVEQASQTFFWVKSKNLSILQSSILASLPKWPSQFSVYSHPDRVLGYLYIYENWKIEEQKQLISAKDVWIYKWIVSEFKNLISNLKFEDNSWRVSICWIKKEYLKNSFNFYKKDCVLVDYQELLIFLSSIKIADWKQFMEYEIWRKDFILWRMLEDKYISFEQYKTAIISSIWFTFTPYKEKIKYPYFVLYVKEYLEDKYGIDVLEKWWLKIYTTINPDFQDNAEKILEKYALINEKNIWAKNAALISIDNKTWYIVSMIWWRNYFDIENWWNNNMILSKLQVGSTFKPFVYALAIENNKIWNNTPIYDLKTQFPNYSPNNFDFAFLWKMTISSALNYSRNIPAIKIFYLSWWEKNILDFMRKLWVLTLDNFKKEYFEKYSKEYSYWASMVLWTWLMTPLELASAYSVFATWWDKKNILPIVKILDSKWNIIENNDILINKKNNVISEKLAYIINYILSDNSSRPIWWGTYLSLADWRKSAAKTWTSTKQFYVWNVEKVYSRNIWTIWYTPQYTTVVWAWNTNWKELRENNNSNWLISAAPIWRDYMNYIHKWLKKEDFNIPKWILSAKISEFSWLLAPDWFPEELTKSSYFINLPTQYDNSLWETEVDILCNWKISEKTPLDAIKKWYVLSIHSLQQDNPNWEAPVQSWFKEWLNSEEYNLKYASSLNNIFSNFKDTECERTVKADVLINSNYKNWDTLSVWENNIEIWFKSNRPILNVQILINWELIKEIDAWKSTKRLLKDTFNISWNLRYAEVKLSVKAIDNQYYSYEKEISLEVVWTNKNTNNNPIIISIENKNPIILKRGEKVDITWRIQATKIKNVNYYINWKALKLGLTKNNFSFKFDSSSYNTWKYILKIEAYDIDSNLWTKEVEIQVN